MKTKNILFVFILFFTFSVYNLKVYSPPTWNKNNVKNDLNTLLESAFSITNTQAFAMNAQSEANRVRALYYYVAGEPSTGYPSGFEGPSGGLLKLFDKVINDSTISRNFLLNGIQSCSDIPTSGSLSVAGYSLGNLTLEFSAGKNKVPNHFIENGGDVFDKRISIKNASQQPFAIIELNCENSATTVTGYMTLERGRRIEVYFQYELNDDRRQLDAYMSYPQSMGNSYDEKVNLRFESSDGDEFKIWAVRTTNDSNEGSFGVAVSGNKSTRRANVSTVEDADATPDNNTSVESGSQTCIDFSSGQTTSGCNAITAPSPNVHGEDFSISGTDATEVSTVELLKIIPEVAIFTDTTTSATIEIKNISSLNASSLVSANAVAPFSFKVEAILVQEVVADQAYRPDLVVLLL